MNLARIFFIFELTSSKRHKKGCFFRRKITFHIDSNKDREKRRAYFLHVKYKSRNFAAA